MYVPLSFKVTPLPAANVVVAEFSGTYTYTFPTTTMDIIKDPSTTKWIVVNTTPLPAFITFNTD